MIGSIWRNKASYTNFAGLSSKLSPTIKAFAYGGVRFNSDKATSKVKGLGDLKEFKGFIGDSKKLSVIDFYATWCGPCKALEPIFEMLANRIPEVNFGRVDVDAAEDIATEYGITAMPTCLFFKNGEQVTKIIGADPPKLVGLIQEHSGVNISNR